MSATTSEETKPVTEELEPLPNDALTQVVEAFKDICLESPLIGEILLNTEREITEKIPTLAVAKGSEAVLKFLVNPRFFLGLEVEEQKAVIFHEISHIVQGVFRRFADAFKSPEMGYLVNLGADCSINQYNRYKLPEGCVTLESLQELINSRGSDTVLEPRRESEYYVKALKEEVDKRKQEMQDAMDGESGEGSGKNDMEEALKEYAKKASSDHGEGVDEMEKMNPLDQAALDSLIKRGIDKQKQKDLRQGTGTGGSILDVLPVKKVNLDRKLWQNFINRCFGEVPSAENFEYVYGRPSRRSAFSVYGKKREYEDQQVYVIIDTSGSCGSAFGYFVGHLNKALRSESINTTLIECDWDVQKVTKNIRRIKKDGIKVHGLGGTDLTKGIDKVLEMEEGKSRKVTVLTLTDGYTDFKFDKKIEHRVLYTKDHTKIEGVEKFAVIEEMD